MPGRPPGPGGPEKPGLMGLPIGPGMPGPGMPISTQKPLTRWESTYLMSCLCTSSQPCPMGTHSAQHGTRHRACMYNWDGLGQMQRESFRCCYRSFACLVLAGTQGRQGRQVVRLGSLGAHQGAPCPCPGVGGPLGMEDLGVACFHLQRHLG